MITCDASELRDVVRAVVTEVRSQADADGRQLDKLAYPEAEAAALCGVDRHKLRDARLRGEIKSGKIGKTIVYERSELLRFLRNGNH